MSARMDLTAKRALVTGAAKGIGAAIVRALADAGAQVAVNYRNDRASAETLVSGIVGDGGVAVAVKGDATRAKDVQVIVGDAERALGGALDIAVANVGPFKMARLETTPPDLFDDVIRSNLNASYYLAHAVLPGMKHRKSGVIITVGLSAVADQVTAAPHVGAYACAKTALASLTRSMAAEFAPYGVRAVMVAPGLINHSNLDPKQAAWMAARVPAGRLGDGREVANVVAFLASDLASYCAGGVFSVNGGWDWAQDRSTRHDSEELMLHLGPPHG